MTPVFLSGFFCGMFTLTVPCKESNQMYLSARSKGKMSRKQNDRGTQCSLHVLKHIAA